MGTAAQMSEEKKQGKIATHTVEAKSANKQTKCTSAKLLSQSFGGQIVPLRALRKMKQNTIKREQGKESLDLG